MGGSPVAIGPWPKGLNVFKDSSLLDDTELSSCINFQIGDKGELISRNGINRESTESRNVFGYSRNATGDSWLYALTAAGQIVVNNLTAPNTPGHITDAAGATAATALVQYVLPTDSSTSVVYLIPRGAGVGARHTVSSDTPAGGTFITGIPKGTIGVVYKDRLFISGNQSSDSNAPSTYRVYYSATGDFESWPVNNFFDVSPGDRDFVAAMTVVNDTLYIFKQRSIWTLSFDTDPFQGFLRKISSQYGASGPYSVATSQNVIYFVGDRSVYELVNTYVEDIGLNLNIYPYRVSSKNVDKDFIQVIENELLVGVTSSAGTIKYYVCNIRQRAWSEIVFPENLTRFIKVVSNYNGERLWSFSETASRPGIFSLDPTTNYFKTAVADQLSSGQMQSINLSFETKEYNYEPYYTFKRIFSWSVDLMAKGAATFGTLSAVFDQQAHPLDLVSSTIIPTGVRRNIKGFFRNRFRSVKYTFNIASELNKTTSIIVYGGNAFIASKNETVTNVS